MDFTLLTEFRKLSVNSTTYSSLHISDKFMQPRHISFPSMSTSPNEHTMDFIYDDQDFMTDGDSSRNAFSYDSIEGEDDDYDEIDDSYVSSPNFDTTVNDPEFANFVNELSQDSFGLVTSFQKIYYFNTCSYEVPHHGNQMQPASQNIALIVESWLTEKLLNSGDTIPILEEPPQISAEGVMTKLKRVLCAFDGLSKVLISIRTGHVYSLHMIDDEIVIAPNHKQFFQEFPLFVDVTIKVQARSATSRHNACRVLVAVEHVTMANQTMAGEVPNRISHHQSTDGTTTTARTASSADGQIFCLLEEVPTIMNVIGNDNTRFYNGANYTGEIIVQP